MTLGSWERAFQNRSSSSFFEHLRQTAPHLLPGGEAIPGEPFSPGAMPSVPHGTTVLALRYRDGVVIAGDRQASEGYQVAHSDEQALIIDTAHDLGTPVSMYPRKEHGQR